ncbi:hypothetical protein Dsin_014328 [Dipteronia sinensis]|uniref:DUF4220 domain-containing protein n=1 Tax=Dipteronia sinensis TaxID=43782 RepID=A0AAE0E9Q7_9ROSI|nr:hypothetical protein Dsin_014328 [Dipteronia sinensis]
MQLFPEKIINLWNRSQVRVMILFSLVLQIILIIFSNQRKLTARMWIRIIVWSAYLTADWVATVALGNLASTIGDSEDSTTVPNNALQEFWAPFLLLHLGGPDTITAYSLEDNELWLRHFVGLNIQVGVAFYVFFRSWGNSALTFLTIPIFISGIIKYGERTYALWSSSSEHFRDSLPSSPDSCQDFVKYVDQDMSGKRAEGSEEAMVIPQNSINRENHYLVLAYFLFNRTKFFFAKRTLDEKERLCIYSIFKNRQDAKEVFKLIAVELELIYDMFYTKAAIVYSRLGIFFRCITFSCSFSALVFFFTIIDTHAYPLIDISITYLLLVGAVLLEVYALILLFLSYWAKLWLIKLKNSQHNSLSKSWVNLFWKFFSHSQTLLTRTKRWSESMGQYNLLRFCLKTVQPSCIEVQKLPFTRKLIERNYLTWVDVNSDRHLQEKILGYLKEQGGMLHMNKISYLGRDPLLSRRGNFALRERHQFDKLASQWCTIGVEFVDSLIIWHIATDLCYHGDLYDMYRGNIVDSNCKISKYLSDYMLYLLVFRQSMLPKGIGEVRYRETCAEATKLFKQKRDDDISSESKACKALLQHFSNLLQNFENMLQNDEKNADDFNEFFKGESHSLLKYGLMVSKQLQNVHERKWEIISDVWVEMLIYAAHNCGWKEHAQQLGKGGELLTHVCLLMTHFGLTKQYVSTHLLSFTPEWEKQMPSLSDLEVSDLEEEETNASDLDRMNLEECTTQQKL